MNQATVRVRPSGGPGVVVSEEKKVDACALVIIGASGDLSRRKLIPAVYNLMKDGALPEQFFLIGTSRSLKSCDSFLCVVQESLSEFSRRAVEEAVWERLVSRADHLTGDMKGPQASARLRIRLAEADALHGTRGNYLFYIATPPSTFLSILTQLRDSGLLSTHSVEGGGLWPRVLIEKPFGYDLASAQQINRLLAETLDESQIYRIDHYLGKETVQNILVFRFGNAIFEPVWNREHIDRVEITAAEEIGVGRRGRLYEELGVVRDVVQNHLLQVLALCTMEPPVTYEAASIRDEKTKVFWALRRMESEDVRSNVILGQYDGYRQEPEVAPDSRTPTYAALKVMIDNWRWQGVPFYLRAGKRLARRLTEVAIHFQPIPLCLFGGEKVCRAIENNILTLRIQPEEGISLRFATKAPGGDLAVGSVTMDFAYARAFPQPQPEAYEHLLLGCMRGDQILFARQDGVELQWRFVEPILQTLESDPSTPVFSYEQGSQGPREAEQLLARDRRAWKPIG